MKGVWLSWFTLMQELSQTNQSFSDRPIRDPDPSCPVQSFALTWKYLINCLLSRCGENLKILQKCYPTFVGMKWAKRSSIQRWPLWFLRDSKDLNGPNCLLTQTNFMKWPSLHETNKQTKKIEACDSIKHVLVVMAKQGKGCLKLAPIFTPDLKTDQEVQLTVTVKICLQAWNQL